MMNFNLNKFKDASTIWQTAVKSRSRLRALLSRAVPVIAGSSSLSWIKATAYFVRFAHNLYRTQGPKGLAIYLKAANLMLIRSTAGKKLQHSREAGTAVASTGSGLPRCICPSHRARIKGGDSSVIRLWLGFFTLYRVIPFRGVLSLNTIVTPGVEIPDDLLWDWKQFLRGYFVKYLKSFGFSKLPSSLTHEDVVEGTPFQRERSYWVLRGLEAVRKVILTSSPSSRETASSSVFGVGLDAWSFVSSGLYPYLHGFCLVSGNSHLLTMDPFRQAWELERDPETIVKFPWLRVSKTSGEDSKRRLGSLSIREEPGKLRVFAMVDAITQWALYPLHLFLFSILKRIPQDGTFNQVKPIKELLSRLEVEGKSAVWSFDLSAATDRIPIVLQEILLGHVTNDNLSYSWARLLTKRLYRAPKEVCTTLGRKGWESDPLLRDHPFGAVKYAVGQPMGAYSSWAMLALVHHAIVQFAAYKAGFREWFTDYGVLGDDIVIAHNEVSNQYRILMSEFGVGIGFHKSVISNNRSLEFAKRYFYKGEEVTPLPLVGIAVGWLGVGFVPEVIAATERLTGKVLSLYQISKFLGVGFRASSGADSRPFQRLPRRLRSALILLSRPNAPRGVANLWEWLRLRSRRTVCVPSPKEVDSLYKYLVTWAAKQRFPRLLDLLKTNLEKFVPVKSWMSEGMFARYCEWFKLYMKEPLEQDFMVSRMRIERMLRSALTPTIMPTEREITQLLEAIDEFEREISLIPADVVRHRSQLAKADVSVPILPSRVKQWMDLGRLIKRNASPLKPVEIQVKAAEGDSPLLRVK